MRKSKSNYYLNRTNDRYLERVAEETKKKLSEEQIKLIAANRRF